MTMKSFLLEHFGGLSSLLSFIDSSGLASAEMQEGGRAEGSPVPLALVRYVGTEAQWGSGETSFSSSPSRGF